MNKFIQKALNAQTEEVEENYSEKMERLRAMAAKFFGDDWDSYIEEGINTLQIKDTKYYLYSPMFTDCFLLGKRDDSRWFNTTLIYSFASLGMALRQAGERG